MSDVADLLIVKNSNVLIECLVLIAGAALVCVKGKLTSIFMTNCFTLQRFYDNDMKVFKYEKDEGDIEKHITNLYSRFF